MNKKSKYGVKVRNLMIWLWVKHVQMSRAMYYLYEHREMSLEVLEIIEYMKPFL